MRFRIKAKIINRMEDCYPTQVVWALQANSGIFWTTLATYEERDRAEAHLAMHEAEFAGEDKITMASILQKRREDAATILALSEQNDKQLAILNKYNDAVAQLEHKAEDQE
jgi:hypothetical protein